MKSYKEILDTVHGYIPIPCDFLDDFVNTLEFQRLQHISQSAICSLFPCANHNRYMHSLGVFHIGQMIVNALGEIQNGIEEERVKKVQEAYLIACLLHDVGHAPFSHSLEDYYLSGANLLDELSKNFAPEFKEGVSNPKLPKPHEYVSAIVVCRDFYEEIEKRKLDLELICRMIIGYPYSQEERSYENCYISLLHGDLVDADRLDYACRDVWASGYSTSSIDLHRLINGLSIDRNESHYYVSFANSVLNEIESLMAIKEFQSHNVFCHRIIAYEQYLLVHAAELMAAHLFDVDEKEGTAKLKEIIHLESISYEGRDLKSSLVTHISLLSDDDLIYLMKQDNDNPYFEELWSRSYSSFALWRTRDEFYSYFAGINKEQDLGKPSQFEKIMTDILTPLGFNDIAIGAVKYSAKYSLSDLNIRVNKEKTIKYNNLKRPIIFDSASEQFYFCYISKSEYEKNKQNDEDQQSFRIRLMTQIANELSTRILALSL